MIDEKTPNLQLPLPNKQNLLSHDVERIAQALTAIDAEIKKLYLAFDEFKQAILTLNEQERRAAQTHFEQFKTANDRQIKVFDDELKKTKTLALAGI